MEDAVQTKTAALLRLAATRPVRARDLDAAGIPRMTSRRHTLVAT
jgi:hypothetical protein